MTINGDNHQRSEFRRLGSSPGDRGLPRREGDHTPLPHPATEPAAGPRRPRRDRPGQDRHRQDPGVRDPPARAYARARQDRSPSAWSSSPPASCACRWQRTSTRLAGKPGPAVLAIYGGKAYEPQIEQLKKGVDVVVGTPGRLIDLQRQKILNLSEVKSLGARRGRRDARHGLPARCREARVHGSASPADHALLSDHARADPQPRPPLHDPTHAHPRASTQATTPRPSMPSSSTSGVRTRMDKPELIGRILHADGRGRTMIFCKTKRAAQKLADDLDRAWLQGRSRARRPRAGRPREGPATVP